MIKQNALCGMALASVLVLASCRTQPEVQSAATARPITTVPATVDRKRDSRQVQAAAVPVVLQLRSDLSLTLPTGWHYSTRGTERAGQPAGMDDALLLAWIGGATFATAPTRLSVIAVERHRLSLDGYLDGAVRALRADERVHIFTTAVTSELRGDGMPAGEIVFTVEREVGDRDRGYQVAFLDDVGQYLVILTVVSSGELWPALWPEIESLVRGIGFERQ